MSLSLGPAELILMMMTLTFEGNFARIEPLIGHQWRNVDIVFQDRSVQQLILQFEVSAGYVALDIPIPLSRT